jgi:hypothetical protein
MTLKSLRQSKSTAIETSHEDMIVSVLISRTFFRDCLLSMEGPTFANSRFYFYCLCCQTVFGRAGHGPHTRIYVASTWLLVFCHSNSMMHNWTITEND